MSRNVTIGVKKYDEYPDVRAPGNKMIMSQNGFYDKKFIYFYAVSKGAA